MSLFLLSSGGGEVRWNRFPTLSGGIWQGLSRLEREQRQAWYGLNHTLGGRWDSPQPNLTQRVRWDLLPDQSFMAFPFRSGLSFLLVMMHYGIGIPPTPWPNWQNFEIITSLILHMFSVIIKIIIAKSLTLALETKWCKLDSYSLGFGLLLTMHMVQIESNVFRHFCPSVDGGISSGGPWPKGSGGLWSGKVRLGDSWWIVHIIWLGGLWLGVGTGHVGSGVHVGHVPESVGAQVVHGQRLGLGSRWSVIQGFGCGVRWSIAWVRGLTSGFILFPLIHYFFHFSLTFI